MFRVLTLLVACAAVAATPIAASAQPFGLARGLRVRAEDVLGGQQGRERGDRPRGRDGSGERAEGRELRLVPLPRVIEGIRRRTPGRLLDAEVEGGGRPVYRVRWAADDGRRIDFIVDAESGQVISAE